MAKKTDSTPLPASTPARPPYMLIEQIQVKGYKSLVDATLQVRPLTLLAGTNSSGKSSIMQPLLLIKQTMEAPYQPAGALVLDAEHVHLTSAEQVLSEINQDKASRFSFKIVGKDFRPTKVVNVSHEFSYVKYGPGFLVDFQLHKAGKAYERELMLTPNTTWANVLSQLSKVNGGKIPKDLIEVDGAVQQVNAFLELIRIGSSNSLQYVVDISSNVENSLAVLIHIPGLRNTPERSYNATFFKNQIKGTFDQYAAGTISQWQQQGNTAALTQLNNYLHRLDLTDSVTAKVKNANEVELSVSRLPAGTKAKPKKADMVNIADVGIGVSQVLPILVALIAAQEGQIVYVEQPELHLHPKAQVVMAELLAEAANRGVRVIVETHSSLLLLTVQTLIAEDKIRNTDVALHWFARDAKGATQVTYVQPDKDGAYGQWPEDFGDVELTAQGAYLDAVAKRQMNQSAA
jgi:predicted ATPase